VIPVAFALSNVFEWWIHRYVMHRPVKGFMGIYKRHTLAHHQFFTDVEPTIENSRDFRIVFFPPYALVTFIALSIPPAALLWVLGLPNACWLLLITNVGLYLNYELFPLLLPREGRPDRAACSVRQLDPPASHRAPQHGTDDGAELQPDLSGRGLVLRPPRT